jgi:membrane protein DedA with SNARE-associated domain
VVPPVPADTFVLLGAFLSATGSANAWLVFLCTLVANVGSAMGVYALAWHYGEGFFNTRTGRFLLHPRQLEKINGFYQKWGVPAILVSRFLPAFRAMVPVFAGVTRVPPGRVVLPLAGASALWYGALVYLGGFAGRNWREIVDLFARFSTLLIIIAGVLIAGFLYWWWRSRHQSGQA